MTGLKDFLRRYGVIMTSYVLLACMVWIVLMIVVPQAVMITYTFWYEDKNLVGQLYQKIDKNYALLDDLDARLEEIEEELPEASAAQNAALKAERDGILVRQKEVEGLLAELEARYEKEKKATYWGARNYEYLLVNEDHRLIFIKTIWASMLVTLLALVFCYPVAFYLAKVAPAERAAMLMLALVIPYWVNELLRVFAWQMILSGRGVLNLVLSLFGFVDINSFDPPPPNYLGDGGVIVGMIYAYILFMVFPLYNVIETLDRNQLEAAKDLGAPWWGTHWYVVIPHAKPGIAVGCIMTFMLAAGSYAVPMALSGGRGQWFTQIIYTWTNETQDMNLGATYALVLLILCILFIMGMMRLFRVGLEDIAK
ncbi:MAG: ABC transporter permease [Kiloniellaceae bacterium]